MRHGGVERVLFDPAQGVVAMGSYSVSPDGAAVAVQAAAGGAEVGDIRFLKVTDGSEFGARMGPAGGEEELTWLKDDWVAYTRSAAPGRRRTRFRTCT